MTQLPHVVRMTVASPSAAGEPEHTTCRATPTTGDCLARHMDEPVLGQRHHRTNAQGNLMIRGS